MAELEFDASTLVKAFKAGLEAGFILATDTTELDKELNILGIDIEDE